MLLVTLPFKFKVLAIISSLISFVDFISFLYTAKLRQPFPLFCWNQVALSFVV